VLPRDVGAKAVQGLLGSDWFKGECAKQERLARGHQVGMEDGPHGVTYDENGGIPALLRFLRACPDAQELCDLLEPFAVLDEVQDPAWGLMFLLGLTQQRGVKYAWTGEKFGVLGGMKQEHQIAHEPLEPAATSGNADSEMDDLRWGRLGGLALGLPFQDCRGPF
jgi:hypothetical protein